MVERPSPITVEAHNSGFFHDGIDEALTHLCKFLGVDPSDVNWDAATETVEGDVSAVIGNIFRAKFGEDWSPDGAQSRSSRDEIARIIDPEAFEGWDGLRKHSLKDMDEETSVRCADSFYKRQKDQALAKADAILAAMTGSADTTQSVLATDRVSK